MRAARVGLVENARRQTKQVTYSLLLPTYPIKPFEKEIARLEALHLSGVSRLETTQEGFLATSRKPMSEKFLRRLGSFAYVKFVAGDTERTIETDQHILEMIGRSVTGRP